MKKLAVIFTIMVAAIVFAGCSGGGVDRVEVELSEFDGVYAVGEELQSDDLTLLVYFTDGSVREVAATDVMVKGFSTENAGAYTFTVKLLGFEFEIDYLVVADMEYGMEYAELLTLRYGEYAEKDYFAEDRQELAAIYKKALNAILDYTGGVRHSTTYTFRRSRV
ncbi:MAG: bacterial Ig-like domain-containing protein [Clostridia bacterium]|nr:bacterial Ig-like domain-containing protein [Clostridia bacterium]